MREVRNDPEGQGHFGASRGDRIHEGTDFVVTPGEDIKSPVDGKVTKHGWCYANDSRYRYIEILDRLNQSKWRLLYVTPIINVGKEVAKGQVVGKAQDVSLKYSAQMLPHVHVEVMLDPRIFMTEI